MQPWKHALIADGSKVCLQLFRFQLKPRFESIRTAASVEGALTALRTEPAVGLVFADANLPGGGAQELLRRLEAMAEPRPPVVVLGAGSSAEGGPALLAGSAGYLPKPVPPGAFAKLLWRLRERPPESSAVRRVEFSSPVTATALDEEGHHIMECEVRNLGDSGALLLTQGPVEVGSELRLQLRRQERVCELTAIVVRVQEPRWGSCPGVAVHFPEADLAAFLDGEV